jgi:uncharacterized OB-fold protein
LGLILAVGRPLPRIDADNRFFWTGGADGSLRFLQCLSCKSFIHPPRPFCHHCLSEDLVASAVPGTGVVDSYTVNRQKWHPALDVPYIIARIAIDGAPGVILTTNIVGCAPETIDIGDKVRVAFQQQGDVFLPLFEKAD